MVIKFRRRRSGRRYSADERRDEIAALGRYVRREAPSRWMKAYALGAKQALQWVDDSSRGGDMNPMRMLDLTEFALRMQSPAPLRPLRVIRARKAR